MERVVAMRRRIQPHAADAVASGGGELPSMPLVPRPLGRRGGGIDMEDDLASSSAAISDGPPPWQVALTETVRAMDPRARVILVARSFLHRRPMTLEQLAKRLEVTRERVRQIESTAYRRLARHAELCAAAQRLATTTGDLATVRRLAAAGFDLDRPQARILLGIAQRKGEMRKRMALVDALGVRWLVASNGTHPRGLVHAAFAELGGDGDTAVPQADLETAVLDAARPLAVDEAEAATVAASALESCAGLRSAEGQVMVWTGSLLDKSERVLRCTGRPMTAAELTAAVEPGNERSLLSQIHSPKGRERLVRTQQGAYALAGQPGITPARPVVELMADAVGGHGGRVGIHRLRRELVEMGCDADSVQMYAALDPRFVLERGIVRLREADEPLQLRRPDDEPGCLRVLTGPHAGAWSYLTTVDYWRLRGASLLLPQCFGPLLGLRLRERRSLRCGDTTLTASWNSARPYLLTGRGLTPFLRARGARDGDFLRVIAVGEGEVAILTDTPPPADAPAPDQLCARLGIPPAGRDELVDALGRALDRPAASASALLRRLRARRGDPLCTLAQTLFGELAA